MIKYRTFRHVQNVLCYKHSFPIAYRATTSFAKTNGAEHK